MSPLHGQAAFQPSFPIGQRTVGKDGPAFIIAEIGINHEGSAETCARMIEEAARAGADAVKLQTVDPQEAYAPNTESFRLFSRASFDASTLGAMFDLSRRLGVEIFSTPGDLTSLRVLESLNPPAYKVSSGLLTHTPLVRQVAATGRPLIMSCGMSTVDEIDYAVQTVTSAGAKCLALLHCVSLYPAPLEKINLRTIEYLEKRYTLPIGFSDHTLGTWVAPVAVAAGACIIEKHFSLDPARADFDHRLSLDPDGLRELVSGIRRVEQALGRSGHSLSKEEIQARAHMRRALVLLRDVDEAGVLTPEDVAILRVENSDLGLAPSELEQVVGRRVVRAMRRGAVLSRQDLA